MNSSATVLIAIVASIAATAGAMSLIGFDGREAGSAGAADSGYFTGTQDIKSISSQKELGGILNAIATSERWNHEIVLSAPGLRGSASGTAVFGDIIAGGKAYSTTNVQVAGIDESDYIKNDSKYVYIVSEDALTIIDAYPAETARIIHSITLDVNPHHMFLNGDRLVIFYNDHTQSQVIPRHGFVPRDHYEPVTHVQVIDVADRNSPRILRDYSIGGHFSDARMIGDYAYVVTHDYVNYQDPKLPVILENGSPIMAPEAFYFDNADRPSVFNTLTAIDIFGGAINSKSFLMGHAGTLYVSEDSVYLTYRQSPEYGTYEEASRNRFFDGIVPSLPGQLQGRINEIHSDESGESSQWSRISGLLQKTYDGMTEDQKEMLLEKISDGVAEYDRKTQAGATKTVIHRISIDEGEIRHAAKGTVPGRLLNQFSMDQSGDRLRVATTTSYYTPDGDAGRANAVFVLDEKMGIVGGLDGIAPGESIYSARFIGDRLYLVTFQVIDPFFVIDLSGDTPRVLGELKIPGFSNYLHPYDEDHVIGIGRDATEVNGRTQQLGVKMALFNVANVSSPITADEVVIGRSSTGSESLHNHKAFFFEKAINILSIPVSGPGAGGYPGAAKFDGGFWHGFYVFGLDETDGFGLEKRIDHTENPGRYTWSEGRTFYIGDVLYTASAEYLKMNAIDGLKEINSIKLGGRTTP